ncbi:MAG: glycosyltransferase [bacterium]|nr:glycosyltransferase [bacterium]
MLHSIISWDSSYRNFFHLINGLLNQDFPRNNFELIYVEQRSREFADKYNHKKGLKSLFDRHKEVKDQMNIKIIYLDENVNTEAYHLSKCNNAGIAASQGDIISVMDGDQLLPKDFLTVLTKHHQQGKYKVFNAFRRMAQYPAGASFKEWQNANNDLASVLATCPTKYRQPELFPPRRNFGPMISAARKYWDIIEGYDTNPLWSTSLSKIGEDVSIRLEMAANSKGAVLTDTYTAHPWHPIGTNGLRTSEKVKLYFKLQEQLLKWPEEHNNPKLSDRTEYADILYEKNKDYVAEIQELNEQDDIQQVIPNDLRRRIISCKKTQLQDMLALAYSKLIRKNG